MILFVLFVFSISAFLHPAPYTLHPLHSSCWCTIHHPATAIIPHTAHTAQRTHRHRHRKEHGTHDEQAGNLVIKVSVLVEFMKN